MSLGFRRERLGVVLATRASSFAWSIQGSDVEEVFDGTVEFGSVEAGSGDGIGVAFFALCASRAWRKYSLLGSIGMEIPGAGEEDLLEGDESTERGCRRPVGVDMLKGMWSATKYDVAHNIM